MAAILNVNDILLCKVVCQDAALVQVAINTLHYQVTSVAGGAPNATDALFNTALDNALQAAYKAWMNNNVQYRGVITQKIRPTILAPVFTTANAGPGVGGANSTPDQVSGLITLRTAFAGRKFRGRIYPPFPPTAFVSATGGMTAGGVTAIGNIASSIPTAIATVNGAVTTITTLIVYHRATFTGDPVQTKAGVTGWATQRRRGMEGRTNLSPI